MRLISFFYTERQFKDQSKTVTRRLGWKNLKPGDLLMGVRKSMGRRKGEPIVKLGAIRIVSVRREPLHAITQSDVISEGFGTWKPKWFVQMFCTHMKCKPQTHVNRIEFEYVVPVVRH